MRCSLGISNFLEEISSLSHSVVFLQAPNGDQDSPETHPGGLPGRDRFGKLPTAWLMEQLAEIGLLARISHWKNL